MHPSALENESQSLVSWSKERHEKFFARKPPGFKAAYYRFNALRGRCENPKTVSYPRYGGRGIECRIERNEFIEWFLREARGDFTLEVDRIDNDGHYEIGNLQLLTHAENVRKGYRQVPKIARVGLRNMKLANGEREICVRVGDRMFPSLNAAGRAFGCQAYIKNRIRKYKSKMPDGTLIEVLP